MIKTYPVLLVDGVNHLCPGCKRGHITANGWLPLLLDNGTECEVNMETCHPGVLVRKF